MRIPSSRALQSKLLVEKDLVDLVVDHRHVIIVSLMQESTHFLLSSVKITAGDAEIAEQASLARPDTYLRVTKD